jgi:hypothetical protein
MGGEPRLIWDDYTNIFLYPSQIVNHPGRFIADCGAGFGGVNLDLKVFGVMGVYLNRGLMNGGQVPTTLNNIAAIEAGNIFAAAPVVALVPRTTFDFTYGMKLGPIGVGLGFHRASNKSYTYASGFTGTQTSDDSEQTDKVSNTQIRFGASLLPSDGGFGMDISFGLELLGLSDDFNQPVLAAGGKDDWYKIERNGGIGFNLLGRGRLPLGDITFLCIFNFLKTGVGYKTSCETTVCPTTRSLSYSNIILEIGGGLDYRVSDITNVFAAAFLERSGVGFTRKTTTSVGTTVSLEQKVAIYRFPRFVIGAESKFLNWLTFRAGYNFIPSSTKTTTLQSGGVKYSGDKEPVTKTRAAPTRVFSLGLSLKYKKLTFDANINTGSLFEGPGIILAPRANNLFLNYAVIYRF